MNDDEVAYLTIQEASGFSRFAESSLRDARFRGRHGLIARRVGGRLLLRRDDVERWIEAGREDGDGEAER